MADLEPPGIADGNHPKKPTKNDRLFDEIVASIGGAVNKVALRSVSVEIAAADKKLLPGQMKHLTLLYDAKVRDATKVCVCTCVCVCVVCVCSSGWWLEVCR
jgi:hypothetical protein